MRIVQSKVFNGGVMSSESSVLNIVPRNTYRKENEMRQDDGERVIGTSRVGGILFYRRKESVSY